MDSPGSVRVSPRVLMVSWLFPPHGSIGARRAWRFAKYLPDYGWTPTVVTRRRVPDPAQDGTDGTLPRSVQVLRTYDAPLWSRLDATLSTFSHGTVTPPESLSRSLPQRLSDRWKRLVDAAVPTETVALHARNLYRVLDALAPAHDVLWTTSYPYHAHLVGAAVARKHGLPFIADLRDPWTLNWVHRQKFGYTRAVERWCERTTLDAADAIVVTTETLAERYRTLYPHRAERVVTVHNAFDPDGGSPTPHTGPTRTIVHFGNVYGPWSLATVLHALAALRAEGAPGASDTTLVNYGSLCDRDRTLAQRLGLSTVVQVRAPLPYAQGIAALRASDLLVLAAWNDPDAGLYLQGKLYDYLLAGVDLLAETTSPELSSIVRRTGAGTVVAPGDVDAMARVLRRVLSGRGLGVTRDPAAIQCYAAPAATRRLAEVLDRVAHRRPFP